MPIRLSDDTNDLEVTFTVPRNKLPYLKEWFGRTKLPNERVSDFVLRALVEKALEERLKFVAEDAQKAHQLNLTTLQTEANDINNED